MHFQFPIKLRGAKIRIFEERMIIILEKLSKKPQKIWFCEAFRGYTEGVFVVLIVNILWDGRAIPCLSVLSRFIYLFVNTLFGLVKISL